MEEEWCEILNTKAVPQLLYPATNTILDLEGFMPTIKSNGFPKALSSELSKIDSVLKNAVIVHYFSLTHQGSFIHSTDPFIELQLLLQPYVLFDASPSKNYHEANINLAIYTPDSYLSKASFQEINRNTKINPNNIFDSKATIIINAEEKKLDSNTRFHIRTVLPIQVFYSLTLVHYANKIVRVLVAKHVLILSNNGDIPRCLLDIASAESFRHKINAQGELWSALGNAINLDQIEFDTFCCKKLTLQLNDDNERAEVFWKGRMFFYIYELSGRPSGDHNFGENEYNRRAEFALLESEPHLVINTNKEFLNKCFAKVIQEIFEMALAFS